MIIAMLLAHLVGDYVLQWDALSRWKSQAVSGVLVHGSIVLAATLLFSLPLDANWWPWAIFIGLSHTLIDGLEIPLRKKAAVNGSGSSALLLFVTDQVVHLAILLAVLSASGYLAVSSFWADLSAAFYNDKVLAFALGYAILTMPAWIVIKFLVYGIIRGCAPDFSPMARSKYTYMVERGLIATLVILGQFFIVPLALLPRLVIDGFIETRKLDGDGISNASLTINGLYLAEMLASTALAVGIGLVLRQL